MRRVFSRPQYVAIALTITFVFFSIVNWVASIPLVYSFLSDPASPVSERIARSASLLIATVVAEDTSTNLTVFALSVLSAINITVLLFYFRMYGAAPSTVGVGSGAPGILSAILGFGCAACGTIFLSASIFSVLGFSLLSLPFQGAELLFIAIGLLSLSIYTIVRSINKPPVCPI